MKKWLCLLLTTVLLLSMSACQEAPAAPSDSTEDTAQTPELPPSAEECYRDFLLGKVQATDKQGGTFFVDKYTKYSEEDTWEKYALYDMNGDEIPELIIKNPWFFEILTVKDGAVKVWNVNATYCRPLNDGSLLYERSGSAPEHTAYQYIRLDDQGNEAYKISFSESVVEKENDLDSLVYHINGEKVDRPAYDAVTGEFFRIGEDKIAWRDLQDVPKDLSGQAKILAEYDSFLDQLAMVKMGSTYLLRDMDGDGVPELLIEEDRKITVYSFTDSVTKVGEHYYGTATVHLLGDLTVPGIFTVTVSSHVNHYGYMTVKDGTLSHETLWADYHSLPKDDPGREEKFSSDAELIAESKTAWDRDRYLRFYSLAEKQLMQALNSEIPFIHEKSGMAYLKNYKMDTLGEHLATPEKYTFVDLDGDGTRELVIYVASLDNGAYMVFHVESDGIYSYEFGIRSMTTIKTDGTLVGSGGAGVHSYYRIYFLKGGYEKWEQAYSCDYPDQQEYRVNDKLVTRGEFTEKFYSRFASIPDVVWVELP